MKRFLSVISWMLKLELSAIAIFFIYRLILFIYCYSSLQPESLGEIPLQSKAFLIGLWFDTVISSYILIVPLVIVCITSIFNFYNKSVIKGIAGYFIILNSLCFAVSAANIPYFKYFFKNINSSILNWAEYGGTTFGMVFGEKSYWLSILLFFVTIFIFGFITIKSLPAINHKISSIREYGPNPFRIFSVTMCSAILISLCLFGIRGRRGYNPIKVSAAYYCDDPYLNQIGLNPMFNLLITSMDDSRSENKRLELMDELTAFENVKKSYQIKGNFSDNMPLSRFVNNSESDGSDFDIKLAALNKPNIVLIFMESMSASLMQRFGQERELTPFLDSLYNNSLSFSNIFSAGIHTNHGLYSTLYSFPTILKRNAMKGSDIPDYSGLPTILRENGYHNMFFMSHESQYDNMNAFFRTNGYNDIYAEENYPKEKIVNSFGVSDDYLLEFAFEKIDHRGEMKRPFFATILTISNHPPYILPDDFNSRYPEKEFAIVEYADAVLKNFMLKAQQTEWFNNTIFVFLGDHGKMVGNPESEMPDSYNHIPVMIYSSHIQPQEITKLGGQIDIASVLLDILDIDYNKIDFGINLLDEERPCMFYTADNMIGCRNNDYLFIYSPKDEMEFYYQLSSENEKYKLSKDDIIKQGLTGTFDFLREYSFSMLQTTEYLVKTKKTII